MSEPAIVHGLALDDLRTHTERINPEKTMATETEFTTDGRLRVKDVRKVEDREPTEFADPNHPMGQRWPYRTGVKSTQAGTSAMLPPGSLVELLPHEVSSHHRLAKDVVEGREKAASDAAAAKAAAEAQAAAAAKAPPAKAPDKPADATAAAEKATPTE